MSILKRLVKESFFSITTDIIVKLSGFLISIIIARSFGSEIFGQYAYAISFVAMFVVVADFNTGGMIIREIAINKIKASLCISNSIFFKTALSFTIIVAIFLATIIFNKSLYINLLIYTFSIYMIIRSYNDFFYSILKAYEKIKYAIYLRMIENFLLLTFFGILLYFKKGLIEIILGFIISSAIILLILIEFIKNRFAYFSIRKDKKVLKYLVKKNLPFGFSLILLVMFFNIDTLLVSFLKGYKPAGMYSIAYLFFAASTIIVQPLTAVFYPILSRKLFEYRECLEEQKKLFNKILKYGSLVVLIGVLISIFYIIFANAIVNITYGLEFQRAATSLKVLSLIIPFWYVYMVVGIIFSSLGKQHYCTYILFVGIILNICLNFILIPTYDEIGAAIASLITMIFLSFIITTKLFLMIQSKNIKSFVDNLS